MDKEDVVYISATRKKDILPFPTTRMDPEGIRVSEISETEKDKHGMVSVTCGI